MAVEKTGYGLIGCGSFGLFCLEAYSHIHRLHIAAVADANPAAARRAGELCGAAVVSPDELIRRDDVQLVHIATPPSTHHELALAAITAGKHVLCEKPLAMNQKQADEILAAAARANVIVPVNFVLRYNAITDTVTSVLQSGALGRVLSARLTNCATDASLGRDHWFWDRAVSGGIFIEHGVHFFDLYAHWLGPGMVSSSLAASREPGVEDRVQCAVLHQSGAVVSHYHGFDQLRVLDRTNHRLVCELGDIQIDGWIPMNLTILAAVNADSRRRLEQACAGACTSVVRELPPADGPNISRGRPRDVDVLINFGSAQDRDKLTVYSNSLRALMKDQLEYIHDPRHERRVTESHGRDAVVMAEAATMLAQHWSGG